MLIKEGAIVQLGVDNSGLLRGLSASKAAVGGFAIAAGAAIAGVSAASVKMAAQLDKDIRLVATLTNATTSEMKSMQEGVRALGIEFGKSFNEIARANYQAVSGGFRDIAEAQKVMRAGVRLSISGNADLVGSTEAVVKALNAFDGSASDAEKAAAQLWGITRDGIITVEQLGRFLQDIPATAASTGIQFHELAAALSTITAKTGHAAGAMDMLRSMLIKMEQQGISGTLVERVDHFAEYSLGELSEKFGEVGARGVLMLQDIDKLKENVAAAANVTQDFNAAVDLMTDGSIAKWERLDQTVADFGITLGDALAGKDGVVDRLTNSLTMLSRIIEHGGMKALLLAPGATLATALSAGRFGEMPYSGPLGPINYDAQSSYKGPLRPTGMAPYPWRPYPADVQAGSPYGIDQYAPSREERMAELERRLLSGNPYTSARLAGAGEGGFAMPDIMPSKDAAKEFERIKSATQQASVGTQLAAAGIMTLSNTLSGSLVGALMATDSAVGRLIAGLLQTVAQIGTQSLIRSIFPGFASGGFTGASGGVVHPNEFVFSADAVRAIGLGNLQAMHASASQTANLTINQTIMGGDPGDVSAVTTGAVMTGLREAKLMGQDRQFKTVTERWRG